MINTLAFGGMIFLVLFIIALAVLAFIFWILMIIDCVKRNKWHSESEQIAWVLIVVLLGVLGAILYYFIVKIKPTLKR